MDNDRSMNSNIYTKDDLELALRLTEIFMRKRLSSDDRNSLYVHYPRKIIRIVEAQVIRAVKYGISNTVNLRYNTNSTFLNHNDVVNAIKIRIYELGTGKRAESMSISTNQNNLRNFGFGRQQMNQEEKNFSPIQKEPVRSSFAENRLRSEKEILDEVSLKVKERNTYVNKEPFNPFSDEKEKRPIGAGLGKIVIVIVLFAILLFLGIQFAQKTGFFGIADNETDGKVIFDNSVKEDIEKTIEEEVNGSQKEWNNFAIATVDDVINDTVDQENNNSVNDNDQISKRRKRNYEINRDNSSNIVVINVDLGDEINASDKNIEKAQGGVGVSATVLDDEEIIEEEIFDDGIIEEEIIR